MPDKASLNIHIEIPQDVSFIIRTLEEHGFEAYAVGGCVRDSLIGRIPGDWDITTSALPQDIKACFRRTVDTGIEHGTVTVMLGNNGYEVTTYRVDGEYRDMRHPDRVSFTASVGEDLKRRDFTINAMAYNEKTGILDLFGGREDLKAGIIRCVGNADERFDEDALRILRAVRFAAQLNFEIEEATSKAIVRHAENLEAVSKERIFTELTKLICSPHIERLEDIFKLGLAPYISKHFDEIDIKWVCGLKELNTEKKSTENKAERKSTDKESTEEGRTRNNKEERNKAAERNANRYMTETEIRELEAAFDLDCAVPQALRFARLSVIAGDMKKENLTELLKGLKPDNETLSNTVSLSERLYIPLSCDRYLLKKTMAQLSPKLFYSLLLLKELSKDTALYREKCGKEELGTVRRVYEDIAASNEPVYLNELAAGGRDLIEFGMKPGPMLGKMLSELLDYVHKEPGQNTKECLREHFDMLMKL